MCTVILTSPIAADPGRKPGENPGTRTEFGLSPPTPGSRPRFKPGAPKGARARAQGLGKTTGAVTENCERYGLPEKASPLTFITQLKSVVIFGYCSHVKQIAKTPGPG